MANFSWMQSDWFIMTVIPLLIFLARVIDVTIGTIRVIFLTRGRKYLAGIMGFFESLIWIVAVSQVMHNLTNWLTYLAFSLGFACGNLVGIMIEERIALGNLIIRIITRREADELVRAMRGEGYAVTALDAQGATGPVKVIFNILKRKKLPQLIKLIKQYNPNAFYTIEDLRFVKDTTVPAVTPRPGFLGIFRK